MNATATRAMDLQVAWQMPLDDIVASAQGDGLEKIAALILMTALVVDFRRVTMAAHASTYLDHLFVIVWQVTQVIIFKRRLSQSESVNPSHSQLFNVMIATIC